jgi:hypothetical protein
MFKAISTLIRGSEGSNSRNQKDDDDAGLESEIMLEQIQTGTFEVGY